MRCNVYLRCSLLNQYDVSLLLIIKLKAIKAYESQHHLPDTFNMSVDTQKIRLWQLVSLDRKPAIYICLT